MKIGDIRIDKLKNYEKYIWAACMDCGKERWIRVRRGEPINIVCRSCSAKKVYHRDVILYPIRSLKSSYVKEYGKDLESHYDMADNFTYKNRIFCKDCPDFETCKGTLWDRCPIKIETIKEMR